MNPLSKIKNPVKNEIKEFERQFRDSMKSNSPFLNVVIKYILKRKGKQIRPLFVFLTAKLFGDINNSTYTAASLIELLHTATLIHDDVIDDSYERRGIYSIYALWKSKIAVLIGDYLYAKGLTLSINNQEYELLYIVSEAVKEMVEGELLQIQKSRKERITEEQYFEIIRKKTSTLISACTESGARSVKANVDIVKKAKQFGEYIGIAFQIKDDLLDYQITNKLGKPSGNDIKEKKFTLPLIYSLGKATSSEKEKIIKMIHHKNGSKNSLKDIIQFVQNKGGIDYSLNQMEIFKKKALHIINEFSDNEAKKSLIELVNFTTSRTK